MVSQKCAVFIGPLCTYNISGTKGNKQLPAHTVVIVIYSGIARFQPQWHGFLVHFDCIKIAYVMADVNRLAVFVAVMKTNSETFCDRWQVNEQ